MATETTLERPLPQNLDAERSVLGAILLDNHALNAAIEKLKPEDFALDHHRRIFNQMIELGETQQAIDLVTLSDQLHRKGELEAAGGSAYIAQLVDGVPRVTHLEHYARIVKEKSMLRNLIHATHAIQQTAIEAEEDADAILDRAESSIFQIAEDRIRTGLVSMKDVVHENIERLERVITEGKRITGLVQRIRATGQLDVGLATLGIDHPGRAALGGQDGLGAEYRGERRPAAARAGGDLQPGNVQGIAADAAPGVAGARGRAQVSHGPLVARGLAADDAIARDN